ncbi:MAG: diguanylate cyclase, partial [Cyanobacteria bacterium P01_H01_bin.130]
APFKSSPHLINPIMAAGIAEYLPHPLSAELLVQRVDRLVHLYQSTVEMRRQYNRERQLIERLLQTNAILDQTKDEVTKLSSTSDRLTQLPNRSGLEERLHQEWRRLARDYETLSVVTLTLDDFAQFKTLYGVTAGDQFLQDVASALRAALQRPADFIARTGPDTFSAILPGTQHNGAMHVAKRLIQTVHGVAIPHLPHGTSLGSSAGNNADWMNAQIVNVCAGVTTQIPDTNVSSFALLAMAEKALDEARAQGGDRAVYLPGPSTPEPPPER